jgi:hypothetical protein
VRIKNYKIRIFFLFFVMMLYFNPLSGNEKLSHDATISLLSCGPGNQLYAAFGHSALWVNDPAVGIDAVYNFGTFDFNTPHFYLRFLRGKLNYALSVSDSASFVEEYKEENRWVYRQELRLSAEQLQNFYDSLEVLRQPEHRFYRYDFFRNNCATRLTDLIVFFAADSSQMDSLKKGIGKTYRQALRPYIGGREWLSLGINLLLGPFADQSMTARQSTFLPENLMRQVEVCSLSRASALLVPGNTTLPPAKEVSLTMILIWLLVLALVVEALWLRTSSRFSNRIDRVLFTFTGLLGLLFTFFWAASGHVSLHVNLNLLWANPFNLLAALAIHKNQKKVLRVYFILYSLFLFFLLINWGRLPQKLPLDIMPLVLVLAFRALNRVFVFGASSKQVIR